jgi:hypothetical protein
VSHDTGEPFLDKLLRDVAVKRVREDLKLAKLSPNPRILVSDTNGCRFALLILALTRADKVDVDSDMLANQLFPEELTSLLSVVRLLRV